MTKLATLPVLAFLGSLAWAGAVRFESESEVAEPPVSGSVQLKCYDDPKALAEAHRDVNRLVRAGQLAIDNAIVPASAVSDLGERFGGDDALDAFLHVYNMNTLMDLANFSLGGVAVPSHPESRVHYATALKKISVFMWFDKRLAYMAVHRNPGSFRKNIKASFVFDGHLSKDPFSCTAGAQKTWTGESKWTRRNSIDEVAPDFVRLPTPEPDSEKSPGEALGPV
eukprot:TRINITY_DN23930_c0_g1_i2.p1 TRINITY_DN23930_c0_g1~~TRINITY_DN23930_c0_g1_i2.p1  ORF type:complete len:225 (-),score=28.30 TRINITY_DN23930_c0_g1_i2:167-841(-)